MKDRVIALGFFDGVHLGHGALLRRVGEVAAKLGAIPAAVTFDTHPENLILKTPAVPLLSSPLDRAELMRRYYGIRDVIVARFDERMMHMPWNAFVTDYLVAEHGAVHLVAGHDFHFGYKGEGNPSTLGFPTVNLRFQPGVLIPAYGVYATRVWFANGDSRPAVTNVGVRPTVDDGDRVTVEGFILDFHGDLYGQTVRMEFYKRLRGERKFDSLEELKQEVMRNAEQTRAYFDGQ